jgi:hypothetical protein
VRKPTRAPRPQRTSPASGVGLATQEAQQRALAAAVDADHTDAVAVAERERDVVEQRAVGAGGLQAGGVDEDHEEPVCREVAMSGKKQDRQAA